MNDIDYSQPQYSEGLILYHLIVSGDFVDMIFDSLEEKHFTIEDYKKAFGLAKTLWQNKQLSPATMLDVLIKNKMSVVMAKSLDDTFFLSYTVGEDKVRAAIAYIRDTYIKNTIALNFKTITSDNIAELVGNTYQNEGQVVNKSNMDKIIKELLAKDEETIPYPFGLLNNIIGGIRKKEYTIIAARPSVGKTAFLEQMFWDATKLGKKCLFISLEMSEEALFKRHILRTRGINLFKEIKTAEEKAELYQEVKAQLGDSHIAVGVFTPMDIERIVKETKPELVLIDYLQQILTRMDKLSDFERVTYITKRLAQLKQKFNAAFLVASQYSRNVKTQQPKLSDLRSSGQIEQDADVVLSLWKKDSDLIAPSGGKKIYIDCLKNRNGKTFGNCDGFESSLLFVPEKVCFFDVDLMHMVDDINRD